MELDFSPKIEEKQILNISPLSIAFIGDGVHTMFVRDYIVKKDIEKVGDYHKESAFYCKAKTQSIALDKIETVLNDTEKDIVRRTRNYKTNNIAKNSNLVEYKKATCFEALIGYLYLTGKYERMNEILKLSLVKGE